MKNLKNLFKEKPYLAWYVKDKKNLSTESMLEHILEYGDWNDYLIAERSLGIKKTNILYNKLKDKKRVNLKTQTINYFDLYFEKYA